MFWKPARQLSVAMTKSPALATRKSPLRDVVPRSRPQGRRGCWRQPTPAARGGRRVKSPEESMNIVDAYRRTGSYRAAAAICGVNHKPVRRVVERAQRGRFERAPALRRTRNTDVVLSLIEERVLSVVK